MCSVDGCPNRAHCRGLCRKHYDADRYARNPEAGRTYSLNYRKNNPEKYFQIRTPEYRRDTQLKTTYGIDLAAFRQMAAQQNHTCAICQKAETLCVDHDHAPPNRIRGLLCQKCNRGLGHFGDNPSLLDAAAQYLRKQGN